MNQNQRNANIQKHNRRKAPIDDQWTEMENYLDDKGYNYDGTQGVGIEKMVKAMAAPKQILEFIHKYIFRDSA